MEAVRSITESFVVTGGICLWGLLRDVASACFQTWELRCFISPRLEKCLAPLLCHNDGDLDDQIHPAV